MKKYNLIFTAMITLGLATLACNVLTPPQHSGPGQPPPPTGLPVPVLLDQTVTIPGGGGSTEVEFEALSGQRVQILLSTGNPSVQPYASLQYPDGTSEYNPLINTAANGTNQVEITIDQTGRYSLTLFDGSNQGGTVAVKVVVLPAQGTSQGQQPTQAGPTHQPFNPTPVSQPSLFKLVKEVEVTPSGDYQNADFVRIGYVPGRDRFIVTFNTMLSQSRGGCPDSFDRFHGLYREYAYKEYTVDMVETGKDGIISCHATTDTGGFFLGDDFYLASAETHNNVEGWNLARFNAVTWVSSADYFYPLRDSSLHAGDPTVAFVNGQIDVSSAYDGPGTHHHFFTTDLQFVSERLLSEPQHGGFSSMITQGGITYFLSSRPGVAWSVIVMQYDPSWTYLGEKTLMEGAATPQGLAFDGNRFYVAYTTQERANGGLPMAENVHLADFDTSWNLIDDVALTSFTLQDQTSSLHPHLALWNNRLYVSYSQNKPAGGIETLQAYVKVYELTNSGH